MAESRYECSWCHEIRAGGDGLPPGEACTGQPSHADHVWFQNHSALRSRLPFEDERRLAKQQVPARAAEMGVPVG